MMTHKSYFVPNGKSLLHYLNPFLQCSPLIPLKTSTNLWFSNVFRRISKGNIGEKRVKRFLNECTLLTITISHSNYWFPNRKFEFEYAFFDWQHKNLISVTFWLYKMSRTRYINNKMKSQLYCPNFT